MTGQATASPLWIRVAFLALAVVSVPGSGAHAQVATMEDLRGRLDPPTATAVQRLIESAVLDGVPSEPLVAKALEGQSKGATGERIILAVRNLTTDLTSARGALGTTAASSEIVAGAGALRSGASTEVLSRLKAARGNQSVLLPLATLTDLMARGMPVDDAAKTVLALAERGASEGDYRVQAGASPNDSPGAPSGAAPAPTISRPPPGVTRPGTPPPGERPTTPPK